MTSDKQPTTVPGLAQKLWDQATQMANQSLFHPFVVGIATGDLPKESFEAFLLQDAFYLDAFAKAFAHAATKTTQSRHLLELIRLMSGVEKELETHHSFLQSFGIELFHVTRASAAAATKNYVDFLLETAKSRQSVAEILAAMTPCARLYSFIGRSIRAAQVAVGSSTENPYQRWIDTYGQTEFDDSALGMELLLEDVANEEGVTFADVVGLYNEAMNLELRFFDAYFPLQQAPVRSLGTCRLALRVGDEGADALLALPAGQHLFEIRQQEPTGDRVAIVKTDFQHAHEAPLLPLLAALLAPSLSATVVYEATTIGESVAFLKATNVAGDLDWYASCDLVSRNAARAGTVARVLIVAGSDSGGGAGVQADLKACTNLGVFSSSAITAVTTQNTHGVHGIHAIPIEDIAAQIECVLDDIGADVIKTGMLHSEQVIDCVAASLEKREIALVVDPVMVATSGHRLLESAAHASLVTRLFPLATIITPNLPEASALLKGRTIETVQDMQNAARELSVLGPKFVLVKGGHMKPDQAGNIVDVLYDAKQDQFHLFTSTKLTTRNTHGTGCTLASSIAALYAQKGDMVAAVDRAIKYLQRTLHQSRNLAIGTGNSGPMLHVL
ncbi:TPA: hypothetical protein N0F65_006545 [Lagenidium giganteum]|uniref:Phosphomethylpyrimidine kinase n=1 Tax=Lagenidium giganteum TaxID=4803 RepID=A0AAV2YFN8_9STRA|nr:TPA: hypothetical protein N0F65_006545 [Lagenidium giganteum]